MDWQAWSSDDANVTVAEEAVEGLATMAREQVAKYTNAGRAVPPTWVRIMEAANLVDATPAGAAREDALRQFGRAFQQHTVHGGV